MTLRRAIRPGAIEPGAIEPGVIQPGVVRPGAIEPGVIQPGVATAVWSGEDSGMALDLADLSPAVLTFLSERHLATLTTVRVDGSPHVVPVGFGFDPDERVVRIITFAGSVKARNADRGGRAAVCQVDGGRWLTLEGVVSLVTEPDRVATAIRAYAGRYREPSYRPDRVAIEIAVDRILGRA